MLDLVYVNPGREHYKEDTTWQCKTPDEALRLAKWLLSLGLNAQRIDHEVYNAMANKLD